MFSQPNPSTPGYAASHSDVFRTPSPAPLSTFNYEQESINQPIQPWSINNIAIGYIKSLFQKRPVPDNKRVNTLLIGVTVS